MKELSEVPDYSDLKREVEALRKRIEDLESGRMHPQPAGHATRWRWLAAKPALALTAVMGAVLALGVLSAQNKQDPLFIDRNGNVGIGTNDPKASLDVNGSARFSKIAINQVPADGQKVIITADGTDVPFNVTDKSNTVNWLTVFKDGNVVMKGGNVGDEKKTPKLEVSGSSLLSNGTGSSAFPWTDGNSYVSGTNVILRSNGNNEQMRLTSDGKVGIGTNNPNAKLDVNGDGRVGGPLDVKGEIRGKLWTSSEYEWKQNNNPTRMTRADRSACLLTSAAGLQGWGESVEIKQDNGYWVLTGTSGRSDFGVRAKAMCIGAPDNSW